MNAVHAGMAIGAAITLGLAIAAALLRHAWHERQQARAAARAAEAAARTGHHDPAADLHTCNAIWRASRHDHDTEWGTT